MGKKVYYTKEKGLGITGLAFIKEMQRHEKRVENVTDKALPRIDKKAPLANASIGRLIGQIELMACCVYGCPGHGIEAHTLQYLCGRSSSFGRAVLRLARMGFYDEALSLVRSLGEIANLLGLFFGIKTLWRSGRDPIGNTVAIILVLQRCVIAIRSFALNYRWAMKAIGCFAN